MPMSWAYCVVKCGILETHMKLLYSAREMFSLSNSAQKQLETLHMLMYKGENINNCVLGCYEQQVFLAIYMGLKFSVKCYIFVDLHATNIHSVMIWMSLVFLIEGKMY